MPAPRAGTGDRNQRLRGHGAAFAIEIAGDDVDELDQPRVERAERLQVRADAAIADGRRRGREFAGDAAAAEAKAKAQAEAKAQALAAAKVKADAEAQQRSEEATKARQAAETKARQEAETKGRAAQSQAVEVPQKSLEKGISGLR